MQTSLFMNGVLELKVINIHYIVGKPFIYNKEKFTRSGDKRAGCRRMFGRRNGLVGRQADGHTDGLAGSRLKEGRVYGADGLADGLVGDLVS